MEGTLNGGWLGLSTASVLVAGAGGFGEAIVRSFVDVGARVAVIDVDNEKLDKLRVTLGEQLRATVAADVSDRDACESAVALAAAQLGPISIFVHAIGVNSRSPVDEISDEDWVRCFNVNTSSFLWLARAMSLRMRSCGGGRIVALSSVSGLLAHPNHGAYASSKGAMNQLVKVMAIEWASVGISVNAVAPGYGQTPLTEKYLETPDRMEKMMSKIPLGRFVSPSDVASAVLFLASTRSPYITGQVIYLDGGRTLD